MNILIEYFVSGKAFFAGTLMVIFAAFLSCAHEKTYMRIINGTLMVVGIGFIIFSGVPIALTLFLLVAVAMAILLFFVQYEKTTNRLFFWIVRTVLVFCVMGMLINETRYIRIPTLDSREYKKMYVIGTSLSAGDNTNRSYVELLRDRYHLNIFNLSKPDATTKEALSQAEMLATDNILILIELGMEEDYLEYKTFLDQLLGQLSGRNRTIVMFELPRLAADGNFVQVQRELAAKYRVKLIPKKVLAAAIYDWNNRNRMQLSNEAHDWLAKLLGPRLENCIKKRELMAPVIPLKPSKRVLWNTDDEDEDEE